MQWIHKKSEHIFHYYTNKIKVCSYSAVPNCHITFGLAKVKSKWNMHGCIFMNELHILHIWSLLDCLKCIVESWGYVHALTTTSKQKLNLNIKKHWMQSFKLLGSLRQTKGIPIYTARRRRLRPILFDGKRVCLRGGKQHNYIILMMMATAGDETIHSLCCETKDTEPISIICIDIILGIRFVFFTVQRNLTNLKIIWRTGNMKRESVAENCHL